MRPGSMRSSPDPVYKGQSEYIGKMKKMALKKLIREERGQVMILILILLVVGSLIIAPLLSYMGAGLIVGQAHHEMAADFYAADAGIEDGLWQIKYDHLTELFEDNIPPYEPYAYYDYNSTYYWKYNLEDIHGENVNDRQVEVTIENVWIPDINVPSPSEARDIIEPGKLIVVGGIIGSSLDPDDPENTWIYDYQIKIDYYKDEAADPPLEVEELGIWLPPGFTYVEESSSLEDDDQDPYYPSSVDINPYKGGEAVVWNYSPDILFTDLPGVSPGSEPMESIITLQLSGPKARSPEPVSWIVTDGVSDIPYTWDADTKVYEITSKAYRDEEEPANAVIDAHSVKSEIRKLAGAIGGDYYAIGNALMGGNPTYRDHLYEDTDATLLTSSDPEEGIPEDATIAAAYLYWTGWIDWHGYEYEAGESEFYDECTDLVNPPWNYSIDWQESGSYTAFYAYDRGGNGELTLSYDLELAKYQGETVTLSWRSWNYEYGRQDDDDCLQYAFRNSSGWSGWETAFCDDIGTSTRNYSFVIPEDYVTDNFRFRFRIQNYEDYHEYCYVDNVTVSAAGGEGLKYPSNPTAKNRRVLVEETARVNQVLFGTTGDNYIPVTADSYQTLQTTDLPGQTTYEGTWEYACFSDVTNFVIQLIIDGDIAPNGAGTYNLGHVVADNEEDPDFSFDFYDTANSTGYPLGTPATSHASRYNFCHAAWSLIIIYSSAETQGHQLYLYDIENPNFHIFEGWHNNPDFDGDGEDGGTISGFLVPDPIEGEVHSAKLTVFAGEGDAGISGDRIKVNNTSLSDGTGSGINNVWNSDSVGLGIQGIDIDTFYIPWGDPLSSGIIKPGDTWAQVDMPTESDGFTVVYIILSFRSEATSGGTITFLLR